MGPVRPVVSRVGRSAVATPSWDDSGGRLGSSRRVPRPADNEGEPGFVSQGLRAVRPSAVHSAGESDTREPWASIFRPVSSMAHVRNGVISPR